MQKQDFFRLNQINRHPALKANFRHLCKERRLYLRAIVNSVTLNPKRETFPTDNDDINDDTI